MLGKDGLIGVEEGCVNANLSQACGGLDKLGPC